ncbi:hypothetical protein FIBSPDRAFT_496762 [Athelia psychrophila]|uniref:Uncharacterized protein n=1 Tax=Athelia psychrophila TaxID=1759441 RepID=A0A167TT19_9AGAM|nr:hypothetical protein FIBSPDRAFT_496762 [Fibularhizoctonia sp. CBS 109695]
MSSTFSFTRTNTASGARPTTFPIHASENAHVLLGLDFQKKHKWKHRGECTPGTPCTSASPNAANIATSKSSNPLKIPDPVVRHRNGVLNERTVNTRTAAKGN